MESLQRGLTVAADAAFGPVTIILILGTGLYLTFGLRFLTIRRLPETLRMLVNPALRGGAKGGGEVSPLGALMTGRGATYAGVLMMGRGATYVDVLITGRGATYAGALGIVRGAM